MARRFLPAIFVVDAWRVAFMLLWPWSVVFQSGLCGHLSLYGALQHDVREKLLHSVAVRVSLCLVLQRKPTRFLRLPQCFDLRCVGFPSHVS